MATYPTLPPLIDALLQEFQRVGVGDQLPKGGLSTILLANYLDHTLWLGDKGPDAQGKDGLAFEYKVSTTNQFAFHCGTRTKKRATTIDEIVTKKFAETEGAYCARRSGITFTEIVYCPMLSLVPHLIAHFNRVKGEQLNAVFSVDSFLNITGANRIV